jgi:hypothetical protein
MKNKKKFAWIRALAAVILAVAILAGTGFGFVDMLRGGQEVSQGADLESGCYVQVDLPYIMDICGVEKSSSGKAVAYYAIAPVGNEFAVIRFPASSYEEILQLETETLDFLKGISSTMTCHMKTVGQTVEISEAASELLQSWFEDNASWMSQSGVISAVEDYDEYLCPVMIEADQVGRVSYGTALTLSVVAAVLVAYALVELVLILTGVYDPKAKKTAKTAKAAKAEPPKAVEIIEKTEERHD